MKFSDLVQQIVVEYSFQPALSHWRGGVGDWQIIPPHKLYRYMLQRVWNFFFGGGGGGISV